MTAKKRCCFCRKVFRPEPQVGDRQDTCGAPDCQRQRRARTQASWRSRNPSYQTAYRLMKRAAAAAAVEVEGSRDPPLPPPALRLPSALASFPWDLAQARLGFAGADLLATLAVLMVRLANAVKDERTLETPLSMQVYTPCGRDP